uniref:Uncharacterized protein n=1 Tax=Ciona savignyi TaxID=51511 RepID=H2YLS8_CIOSA
MIPTSNKETDLSEKAQKRSEDGGKKTKIGRGRTKQAVKPNKGPAKKESKKNDSGRIGDQLDGQSVPSDASTRDVEYSTGDSPGTSAAGPAGVQGDHRELKDDDNKPTNNVTQTVNEIHDVIIIQEEEEPPDFARQPTQVTVMKADGGEETAVVIDTSMLDDVNQTAEKRDGVDIVAASYNIATSNENAAELGKDDEKKVSSDDEVEGEQRKEYTEMSDIALGEVQGSYSQPQGYVEYSQPAQHSTYQPTS